MCDFAKAHFYLTEVEEGIFLTSQLSNSLHLTNIFVEDQLKPNMKIVTQSRPWTTP